jgi:hypothetical protein
LAPEDGTGKEESKSGNDGLAGNQGANGKNNIMFSNAEIKMSDS